MKLPRFELFYSPMCALCQEAKAIARQIAEEKGIALEEINIMTPEGEKKAQMYGIRSVPYLIIDGQHHISGLPTKEAILKVW